jgi:hypothetical protein
MVSISREAATISNVSIDISQTQLQSQVIMLQSTVISLLESALYDGKLGDINKLFNASEFARDGSVRALRDQYQRMLQAAPIQRPQGMIRRTSSTPSMNDTRTRMNDRNSRMSDRNTRTIAPSASGRGPTNQGGRSERITEVQTERSMAPTNGHEMPLETSAGHMFDASGALYCRYAERLQGTGAPLDDNFSADSSCACPQCGTKISIQPGRAWRIDKELVHEQSSSGKYQEARIEERTYYINNRFIVKCHREKAGFACLLCFRYRDSDTLCETIQRFVNHIWKKHSVAEYEVEPDIETKEVFEERLSRKH